MARQTEQTWLRKAIAICCLLLLALGSHAEEELEYKMDMGGGIGGCFLMGDAGSTPFANLSLMGAITARRIFNPRMALKANLAFGHVHGSTSGTFIPTDAYSQSPQGGTTTVVDFKRNIMDIGIQYELNFLGYGSGASYKGLSRIAPYILVGVGMTIGMGGGADACYGMNIPVGVGVKYKVMPRVNIGFEWTARFSTTDKLDATPDGTQLCDPYGVSSGMFKNKDCYSFSMFFITYDMFPKYRKCNN